MREPRLGQLWTAGLLLIAACHRGGTPAAPSADAAQKRIREPQPLVRQDCEGGTAQSVDANNDGRPDIEHHLEGGKRLCTAIDLNFDGAVDVLRYYGSDGQSLKFEQHDYDFDGRVDDQVYYEAGVVSSKELDTNFDGLIDTWMWCKGPIVNRAERARRKPGHVDTWETYAAGQLAQVEYDENSDGRPEKWEIFQAGSLTETRLDTNGDGKVDSVQPSMADNEQDTPVSCDGTPLPTPSSAPVAPATGSGGEKGATGPQADVGSEPTSGATTTTGNGG